MKRTGGREERSMGKNRFAPLKAEIDIAHDIVPTGESDRDFGLCCGENMLACVRDRKPEVGEGKRESQRSKDESDALSLAHDLPPCSPQSPPPPPASPLRRCHCRAGWEEGDRFCHAGPSPALQEAASI